jgi:RNA polymerase sigma-70 factor (sigma-E family)
MAGSEGVHVQTEPSAGSCGSEPITFEALYQQQYARMVGLANLLCGSRAVAEDLVQDAFVRVHRHWRRVGHPVPYLRASVVNACRNEHRRRRVVRRHRPDAPPPVEPEVRDLLDALAVLPERRRAAIVLRFYEDLPEADIAAALDCPTGTVKSLIHRGLAQLREVIER